MDDILKEAIADAKALRATALENAKIALEEAFTPRLKNMLSQKIQSEEMPDNEEYGEGEGEVGSGDGHMEAEGEHEVDERMHDEDDEVEERMHDEDDKEVEERMHGEDDDEVEERMKDEDEEEVKEAEHMEDEGEHMEDEGEHMEDEDMHDEDELDLESVIKELEEELDSSEVGDWKQRDLQNSKDSSKSEWIKKVKLREEGGSENSEDEVVKEPVTEAEHGDDKDELEEIDLEEVLQALSEEEHQDEDEDDKKVDEMQTQLKEYKDTIGYLREKLNEVNLLNAKLLFTNKLFRGFGLNNNQKLRVVEQFDRAQNLREIKLVYATLAESFKGNGNKKVNESKGQDF